jgi:hypothetical protein
MAQFKGDIDSSRIPVEGAAGLGLVAVAGVVVYAIAPLRSAWLATVLGGAVVGLALLAVRHRETRTAALCGMALAAIALVGVMLAEIGRSA